MSSLLGPELEVMQVPTMPVRQLHHRSLASMFDFNRPHSKILIPYTTEYPEARAAVRRAGIVPLYAPCTADDDYYWYIHELWAYKETFVIIEHDIAPRPDDLEKLLTCPQPWCGFVYSITNEYAACNGFTKYDASLLRIFPEMMDWVGERNMGDDGAVQRSWVRLDTRMFQFLHNHGHEIHQHWPPVPHYNPRQHLRIDLDRGWCSWPARSVS